jgi:hypothetical protein
MRIRIQLFTFTRLRFRIVLLNKVMGISLQAFIVSVHGPPRLFFEPLKPLNFFFNADLDPDPAFHSSAAPDSDPASKNNADPDPHDFVFQTRGGGRSGGRP